jgi:hypothetical protein
MPDETPVQIARIEENLKAILQGMADIKSSIEHSNSTSAEAIARASLAHQTAEAVKTVFVRIDEVRDQSKKLQDFASQLTGGFKAAAFIFGFFQVLIMSLVIWSVSTIADLRENKAVINYRIQILEGQNAKH